MTTTTDKPTTEAKAASLSSLLTLTPEMRAAYIAAVERVGMERAKAQGVDFNFDDYMCGAMVFLNEAAGMGAVPPGWIFDVMRGTNPFTGETPDALTDGERCISRAINELFAAQKQFDMAGGENTPGVDAESAFTNASRCLQSLKNLFQRNRKRDTETRKGPGRPRKK